jgi:hypothetical protein
VSALKYIPVSFISFLGTLINSLDVVLHDGMTHPHELLVGPNVWAAVVDAIAVDTARLPRNNQTVSEASLGDCLLVSLLGPFDNKTPLETLVPVEVGDQWVGWRRLTEFGHSGAMTAGRWDRCEATAEIFEG